MVQKVYTVQNIKTGKIFKMSHSAMQVAKKMGMDKDFEVLPTMEREQLPASAVKPVQEEKVVESFMDADDQYTDIEDDQPKKKRKYKTKNNE